VRGVRVNAVCPGRVKTEMDIADQAAGGGYTDDDIARSILLLADPAQSGFVSATALAVGGGWTADGRWQSVHVHIRQR